MVQQARGLVVGGGIGGLCAALLLRRDGIDTTVFERNSEIRTAGATVTVWPFVYRHFRRMGVMDAIRAAGGELERSELRTWDGTQAPGLTMGAPMGTFDESDHPICIMRTALYDILLDELGRENLILGSSLATAKDDGDSVTATFEDGRVEVADFLIGADGINSTVRSVLFPDSLAVYNGQTIWRSVVTPADGVFDDVGFVAFGDGERFGAEPAGNGLVYWFAAKFRPEHSPEPSEGRQQWLLDQFRDWMAPIAELIESTPNDAILRHDVYSIEPLDSWGSERVKLLGDAAHAVPPHTGQGACMAIEDAAALADNLVAAATVVDGLSGYERVSIERMRELYERAERLRVELSETGPSTMHEALETLRTTAESTAALHGKEQ